MLWNATVREGSSGNDEVDYTNTKSPVDELRTKWALVAKKDPLAQQALVVADKAGLFDLVKAEY